MNTLSRIITTSILVTPILFGCTNNSESTSPKNTQELDAMVRSELGIGLVGVSLLLSSGETVFHRADSMTLQEKKALDELEKSGLATISEVPTGEGPFLRIAPTQQGETIRNALNPQ